MERQAVALWQETAKPSPSSATLSWRQEGEMMKLIEELGKLIQNADEMKERVRDVLEFLSRTWSDRHDFYDSTEKFWIKISVGYGSMYLVLAEKVGDPVEPEEGRTVWEGSGANGIPLRYLGIFYRAVDKIAEETLEKNPEVHSEIANLKELQYIRNLSLHTKES